MLSKNWLHRGRNKGDNYIMTHQTIEHVAAGQFKSGKNLNHIYQSYLGTCLGVALFDARSRVGGMIHILLPEPPSISNIEFPEKYASTGIPLLLKELYQLGASPDSLKASIAGGALVGPVSQHDMNLDIGGRSADIATAILNANGIEIIESETGGFFTCTLELDMLKGTTRVSPPWEYTVKTGTEFKAPTLDDIFTTIGSLKPIPQTALKILRMFQSSKHDINEITQELSKDQVLSAQTLKLCNSALFAGLVKIDSLKDAVLLMGEQMLIKTIITAAVKDYFSQTGTSGYSLCKGGLFYHAIGVATLSEKIAADSEPALAKIAYTAGLLHDIGKVVLDQYVSDSAPLFFRKLSQEKTDFKTSEKKVLGITHCEAGGVLAKQWNFSEALSKTIQFHHEPQKAGKHQKLVNIVMLADSIIEKFSPGFDLEKTDAGSIEKAMKLCGHKMDDLPDIVDAIPFHAFSHEEPGQS